MKVLKSNSTDPYFNMAMEEYFLDTFPGECIILWRNQNTVVVGRNQNSLEEIDPEYVRTHQIAVVRRLTGGGAVFHDLGNINFTVIQADQEGLFSDYAYFTKPVCAFLQTLGIKATLSGRNDLLIDGMKFSGNAQTRRSGKIMHHGTLMFDTDAALLAGALKPSKIKIESKSIKSVKSRVTNILPHLQQHMTPESFLDALFSYFLSALPDTEPYQMTKDDCVAIQTLRDKKYSTWEWNYGTSPRYTTQRANKFPFGIVDVRSIVENGRITAIKIYGDFFGTREISDLETALLGIPHERAALLTALSSVPLADYISGMDPESFAALLC